MIGTLWTASVWTILVITWLIAAPSLSQAEEKVDLAVAPFKVSPGLGVDPNTLTNYLLRAGKKGWLYKANLPNEYLAEVLKRNPNQPPEGVDAKKAEVRRLLLPTASKDGGTWFMTANLIDLETQKSLKVYSVKGAEDLDDMVQKLWEKVDAPVLLHTLKGHTARVMSVAISPDGRLIASASHDKTVRVWSPNTGREPHIIKPTLLGSDHVSCVAFSPDSQQIIGACYNELYVWDSKTGKQLCTIKGGFRYVVSMVFSPDGKRIAIGSPSEIGVWDVKTGQELFTRKTSPGFRSPLGGYHVGFSPDGKRIASGSIGEIVVWDAENGREILTLKAGTRSVACVTFSPDGKRIASGSYDGTVRVWNSKSGSLLLTLKAATENVRNNGVMFSHDGTTIAAVRPLRKGGKIPLEKHIVGIWDTKTGQEMLTLKCTEAVYVNCRSITFSLNLKTIVVGLDDYTVQVWGPLGALR